MSNYYLWECEITRGGFTSERIYDVGDGFVRGVTGVQYVRDRNKKPLTDDVPSRVGIKGYVMVKELSRDGHAVRCQYPDGQTTIMAESSLIPCEAP